MGNTNKFYLEGPRLHSDKQRRGGQRMLTFAYKQNKTFSDKLMKPASRKSKKMFFFFEQETQGTSRITSI